MEYADSAVIKKPDAALIKPQPEKSDKQGGDQKHPISNELPSIDPGSTITEIKCHTRGKRENHNSGFQSEPPRAQDFNDLPTYEGTSYGDYKSTVDSRVAEKGNFKGKIMFALASIKMMVPLVVVFLGILVVFIVVPLLSFFNYGRKFTPKVDPLEGIDYYDIYFHQLAANNSAKNQPLVPKVLPIDPDTPVTKRSFISSSGKAWGLVFSDEFNKDGRSFSPGEDKVWESQDLWYWPTNNLEFLKHPNAYTKNGNLLLKLENVTSEPNLNFTSGMVNTWNKLCFQGGYLEVNVSFPSPGNASGYWPAIWTLGNLGRAGFGSTNDGLWPYTYNSCDSGVLVNQTNEYLSWLPGQRLNACVCSGDHPSPGIGRGAPEIDLFEGTVAHGGLPMLSMSFQVAPFDYHSLYNRSKVKVYDEGSRIPGKTHLNTYLGDTIQQAVSALHYINPKTHGGLHYQVFGFEYKTGPEGYIIWYSDGKPVFRMNADAVGPDGDIGISQRVIPEEPMNFGNIELDKMEFPSYLYVDYVRLYQDHDNIRLSCDPPDRPTADYILNHSKAYYNRNLTKWQDTGYGIPSYSIDKKCKTN
ncbi:putative beta-glucan synthesis-associated protein [Smittium mucronatum]|uniref:Putative beta-glucan synthesis-associated protein n=1 Tax=Smittium mucronatum TaxID=133383 RepID=A0A1R0H6M0_9FUNG|nr:putative beta-glucan synthesis-associated protein [Smittium mucronatum]